MRPNEVKKPPTPAINATQPNDKTKILDPYCGSGTTLIACKRLGIECHGIEMNEEYIKVAKARLGEDLSEYGIFDTPEENDDVVLLFFIYLMITFI